MLKGWLAAVSGLSSIALLIMAVAGNPVVAPLQVCWVFYDPATVIPATIDPTSIWANRTAPIQIVEFWCETDANTATINIQRDDGTPVNILSSNLVCDTNPGQDSCASGCDVDTISATEDNIAIDEELDHVTVSLGAINRLTVCFKYVFD